MCVVLKKDGWARGHEPVFAREPEPADVLRQRLEPVPAMRRERDVKPELKPQKTKRSEPTVPVWERQRVVLSDSAAEDSYIHP